jgi:DNA methylase
MRNGYYCCDAASMIAALPDISVDLTITSPPYGSMKDYGASGQIGFGQTYEEYLNSLVNVFAVLFRKTAPTGSLWVVADTFKEHSQLRLLPFDLANRLNSVGWSLRDGLENVIRINPPVAANRFSLDDTAGINVGQTMVEIGRTGAGASCIGLFVGLVLCAGALRVMRSVLYGIGVYDAPTLSFVVLSLLFVTLLATTLPTLRIAKIDPANTLREE